MKRGWFFAIGAILLALLMLLVSSQIFLKAEETIVKKFSPTDASVVIYKHSPDPPDHPSDKVSGTLITYKGKPHIITAQHVLPPTQIKTSDGDYVIFSIGPEELGQKNNKHIAKVVKLGKTEKVTFGEGADAKTKTFNLVDLALLETNLPSSQSTAAIAKKRPTAGETVLTVGLGAYKCPIDCFSPVKKSEQPDWLITKAHTRSGCSGGGLFNIDGELVGVHILAGGVAQNTDTIRDFLELPPIPPAQIKRAPLAEVKKFLDIIGDFEDLLQVAKKEKNKLDELEELPPIIMWFRMNFPAVTDKLRSDNYDNTIRWMEQNLRDIKGRYLGPVMRHENWNKLDWKSQSVILDADKDLREKIKTVQSFITLIEPELK